MPYFMSARGAFLRGADGREYIDLCMSNGAALLGHGSLLESDQVDGDFWGYESPLAPELAQLIAEAYPGVDRMRFCLSGSEAVAHAIRLARLATGRRLVLKFGGHFHGNVDPLQVNWRDRGEAVREDGTCVTRAEMAGVDSSLPEQVRVAPFNLPAALEKCLETWGSQLAAVILEPVAVNAGCVHPLPGFLRRLRELCDRHGCLLVFDEILSGFRSTTAGTGARAPTEPDLVLFGKVVGGGWPLSVVAGSEPAMSSVRRDGYFLSGTHAGSHPLVARAVATLRELRDTDVLHRVADACSHFVDSLSASLARHRVPARLERVGDRFSIWFGRDPDEPIVRPVWTPNAHRSLERLTRCAYRRGVFMRVQSHHGISASHTDRVLDEAVRRLDRAVQDFVGGECA